MKKLTLVAAGMAALCLAGAAAPSFAETLASCEDQVTISPANGAGEYSQYITTDAPAILAALKDKGINVTDISDWGGCVRADVVRKDGSTAMEFFDPNTLQRVSRNG